jgi:16S rRNA G527 N7-methylase RsmG
VTPEQRLFQDACAHLQVEVPALAARLPELLNHVGRFSQRWNLVGDPSPRGLLNEHVLEALAVVVALRRAGHEPKRIVDVGAGAGVESLCLLLAFPSASLVAVEPRRRRADAIEVNGDLLGVGRRLQVVRARLGEADLRGPFDLAVSRATFSPEEWTRQAVALLSPGGYVVAHVDAGRDHQALARQAQLAPSVVVDVPNDAEHAVALAQWRGIVATI